MARTSVVQYGFRYPDETDLGTGYFPFCPKLTNISPVGGLEYPLSYSLHDLVELYHRVQIWNVTFSAGPYGGAFGGTMDGWDGVSTWFVLPDERKIACCQGRRIHLSLTNGAGASIEIYFYFCSDQDFSLGQVLEHAYKDTTVDDTWIPQMSVDFFIIDPTLGHTYTMSSSNRGNTGTGIPSACVLGIDGFAVPCYIGAGPDFPAGSFITFTRGLWWGYDGCWDTLTGAQLITPLPYGL